MENFLNPNEILRQLELRQNMIAADFGCGSGGWAIPLSQILTQGKIYAIDILEEPLLVLKNRIKAERIFNIEPVLSDVEKESGSGISNSICDLVLMTNILFQAEEFEIIIKEGLRVLKPGGRILIVDWLPEAGMGPKDKRISPSQVKEIAGKLHLQLLREFRAGTYHYGLIFEKIL